jgi:UDP:flavonoid glycosyltransferase YjiC (YdhE family)
LKRIVFVAPPFAGHLYPQLPLAAAARGAGYAVSVITTEAQHVAVRSAGLPVDGLRSIPHGALEAIANAPVRVGSNPVRLLAQFRQNLTLLPAIQQELTARWTEQRPDLVVADSVAPVAGLAAAALGIPWVTTIATPFAIENRHGVPAYCGGWRPRGWRGRDALGRAAIRSFKRAVAWYLRRELAPLGGRFPYRPDGTESIYSPRAILGFGIAELEFPRDWPPVFQMIGPIIDTPRSGPPLVLPAAARHVLVTLGTHLLWAKATLVADTAALAAQFPDVHFTISLGGADAVASGPPAPNMTVHSFVPYTEDLTRFDAIVHHGGAGVTYASILAGVPSVVIPHDYDQFDFAARIEHHRLGLRAPSLPAAAHALRRMLDHPNRMPLAAMRAHARRYRPAAGFLRVVDSLIAAPSASSAE